MGLWMLDLMLVVLAVLFMAFVVYKLVFSADESERRELALRPRPAFDRRNAEHADRRLHRQAPPSGIERRFASRR